MRPKMFYGASPIIFKRAKTLRMSCTEAEKQLWNFLKTRPAGVKFRRQHPLKSFIADFYAHSIKLVIEVDGSIHAKPEVAIRDLKRQELIESEGVKVIRFTNGQVFNQLDWVKERIIEELTRPFMPENGNK